MKSFFSHKKNSTNSAVLNSTRGGFFHRIGRDPYMDWGGMFGTVVVITLALIALGGYAYMTREHRLSDASNLDTAKKPETIDEATLQSIIERFSARAAERAVLIKGYGGFGDPSL
ncbi:MAG: hypothetical protein AAB381_01235 [Patescibacteria group bacterium]